MSGRATATMRTVRISPADAADARRVLQAVLRIRNYQELPRLTIVDPAELALEPGMYRLIGQALEQIWYLTLNDHLIEHQATLQVPATQWSRERGNPADALVASLPDDFRQWCGGGGAKIETLPEPVELGL